MARRRRSPGTVPHPAQPRATQRAAPTPPRPRRWLGYVFAFSLGLVITGQLGILAANQIGEKRNRAVDTCLEAAGLANSLKTQLTSTTPPPTATPSPAPSATPAVTSTPRSTLPLPATPVCPEKSTSSIFTTILGLAFYAGVAGIAFVVSQIVARRAAAFAYQRRLRRGG